MKLDGFLYFAMSGNNSRDEGRYLGFNNSKNETRIGTNFLEIGRKPKKSNNLLCPKNSHGSEFDEGFCIYNLSPKSIHNKSNCNISNKSLFVDNNPPSETMRRVRSTPNLLQIPTSQRSRKKSDDSALGSGEESESSDKFSDVSTDYVKPSDVYFPLPPPPSVIQFQAEVLVPTLATGGGTQNLRPPSVVVSDHDLCPGGEASFITLDEIDADFSDCFRLQRRISDCSTCSSFSLSELDFTPSTPPPEEEEDGKRKISRWKTVRHIFHQLTPFILTYKNSKYPWVQLAGHQGHFKPGEQQGTILKKFCEKEKEAFEQLMKDSLRPYVPQYYGTVEDDIEKAEYIQLQDLLSQFDNPCVMDCKMGVRTYLEEELLKAKEKPKLRKDMYEKMCQIDPAAPTPDEHQLRAVTKPRYMVWRETISTTSTFGFRIEGVRKSDGFSSKDYKTTRTEEQVIEAFDNFADGFPHTLSLYITRLQELREALKESQFFGSHEVIGSSLLFVHDSSKASVWMIDFAKTCRVPEDVPPISHDNPWSVGNHEDGYIIGLTHLIKVFTEIRQRKLQE